MGRFRTWRKSCPGHVALLTTDSLQKYLAELDKSLDTDRDARRAVILEIEGHVLDAVEAGEDENEVVARLGDVGTLARDLKSANDPRLSAPLRLVLAVAGGLALVGAVAGPGSQRAGVPAIAQLREAGNVRPANAVAMDPSSGAVLVSESWRRASAGES